MSGSATVAVASLTAFCSRRVRGGGAAATLAGGDRALLDLQPRHRAIAEMAVDALQHARGEMLQLQRRRPAAAHGERALVALATWEAELDGQAGGGERGARDLRPMGEQPGFRIALRAQRRLGDRRHLRRQRHHVIAARLRFGLGWLGLWGLGRLGLFGHGFWSLWWRRHEIHASPENGRNAAGLVRPASAELAVAGEGGAGRGSVPCLAERDHAAADHGAGGEALLRDVPAALADGARSGGSRHP